MICYQYFYAGFENYAEEGESSEGLLSLWRAGTTLFAVFYSADMLAHCVFAMRYWVLSKKIVHLTDKTKDKHFKSKIRVLYYVLFCWIFAQGFLEVWFWWEPRSSAQNNPAYLKLLLTF